ncbi:SDR family oxidoreductase [Flexivirga caeni]|uniref:SDR family oxidoreductase n=1 Tax=Flexivirga caeni TaxID=2294115 RepID=A0A3M9MGR7_9MICO|nr:SDR family oxidoreductase [Flexivirga caeni]RNI24694.1 SDR family oxidoreductase [Flexivirga caeni]
MGLFDLSGRTALVTGSTRGIGLTLAHGPSAAGAEVILHGRDISAVRAAAAEVTQSSGQRAHASAFDLTDPEAIAAATSAIVSDFGTPDILVNNAGIQRRGAITDFTPSDWQALVATNLTPGIFLTQQFTPGMIARGSGKIINIASIQSSLARPGTTAYGVTKGGVVMLTKGLCAELAPHGIQANALAPGYFATDLTASLVQDREFSSWIQSRTPAGRWGRVEELVGAVVFLASRASDFVNGQTLYVDGGMTAVV